MEAIFNQAEWLAYHHLQSKCISSVERLHIIKAQALYKLARLRSDFILQKARFHREAISSALADFTLIIRGITFACLRAHITVCISKQYHCRRQYHSQPKLRHHWANAHQRRPLGGSWLRRRLRENALKV